MRETRLLVFDMDGVLVDTGGCHARAFAELWDRLGIEGPGYDEIAGRRTSDVIQEFAAALHPSPSTLRAWTRWKQERARALLSSEPIRFHDSEDALRSLARAGLRMALGSGASRATVDAILGRFGWTGLFGPVVCAEDVERGKPAPDVYRLLLERSRVEPSDALVVEDSAAGIEAGLACGARVVSVRSGLRSPHPRFVASCADLAELARCLTRETPHPCRA